MGECGVRAAGGNRAGAMRREYARRARRLPPCARDDRFDQGVGAWCGKPTVQERI
jgi:hypothetical protein